jgi:hypothetical protein
MDLLKLEEPEPKDREPARRASKNPRFDQTSSQTRQKSGQV